MSKRADALLLWLERRHQLVEGEYSLEMVADDASFRRYSRLVTPDISRIIMDSPPDKEPAGAFVDIAIDWQQQGLPVPRLYAADLSRGFIELEDLGSTMLRDELPRHDETWADHRLTEAMRLSARIAAQPPTRLPPYNVQRLAFELDLFPGWALNGWLLLNTPRCWTRVRQRLIERMLDQPQVTTHRDFHAGNLMLDHTGQLRVIDFQGAWRGAIGYDPGSLLRDRNAPWSLQRQQQYYQVHHQQALALGLTTETSSERYQGWIDEASAQRSLKVLGLFCRLAERDAKPHYRLNYERHFFDHARQALGTLSQQADKDAPLWQEFTDWLDNEFEPRMTQALTPGA